jgi:hypothetical protein
MAFAQFISTPLGRGIRIVAGFVLIALGIAVGSVGGAILVVVGILPIVTGALNVCVLAPMLHAPFSGRGMSHSR